MTNKGIKQHAKRLIIVNENRLRKIGIRKRKILVINSMSLGIRKKKVRNRTISVTAPLNMSDMLLVNNNSLRS
jgi:hypothetical protein